MKIDLVEFRETRGERIREANGVCWWIGNAKGVRIEDGHLMVQHVQAGVRHLRNNPAGDHARKRGGHGLLRGMKLGPGLLCR